MHPDTSRNFAATSAALLTASAVLSAHAATQAAPAYPVKPIRIIVPFAPQGPNDILARLVGGKLTERWGQQVIVDNRPGGGTVIGTEVAARAPGDGHTLLMVSIATAVNPTLRKSLPYDTLNDFAPVIQLAAIPNVLVSHPSVPATSVSGLVKLARARPGEIAYASGGVGGATHLAGELLSMIGGVQMTHVPYKGAAPATVALASGEVSWMFASILPTLPHIKTHRFRALAVSGSKRSPVLAEVPTVAETLPGFEATSWFGLFTPAGTPREVIGQLNTEIARILTTADIREQLQRQGADPVGDSPDEFAAHFKAEMAKWGKVIKAARIEPN
jgi:tripartite-type tricarboxylate transporter receptor subunit TctC